MRSEKEFRPRVGPSNPHAQPEDWLSARKLLLLIKKQSRSYFSSEIVRSAAEGYLHTWAESFTVGETRWGGAELPTTFWIEAKQGVDQDWEEGDFLVEVGGVLTLHAHGVMFHRGDLTRAFPRVFVTKPMANVLPELPADHPPKSRRAVSASDPPVRDLPKGGRPMSEMWPLWVSELVAIVYEDGFPSGLDGCKADELIALVADRLALRGLEGPSRTTVQATAKMVLHRLRAGN